MSKALFFDLGTRTDEVTEAARSTVALTAAVATERNTVICPSCGIEYGVGQSPWCKDRHEAPLRQSSPNFAPYFDYGLGAQVEAPDQRRRLMRENKLEFRDHPSKGDLSARRDRIAEAKRPRAEFSSEGPWLNVPSVDAERSPVLYAPNGNAIGRRAGF